MSKRNPFSFIDLWQAWFDQDPTYTASRRGSLQTYLQQRQKTVNPLTQLLLMTLRTYSKHTVASLFVLFLLLTSLTTLAVQAFAPEAYKPLTTLQNLFKANKQNDKDPYTALKPDNDNDVSLLEACDLAIKYPKRANDTEVEITSIKQTDNNEFRVFTGGSYFSQVQSERVSIKCSTYSTSFNVLLQQVQAPGGSISIKTISREALRDRTGWLITETDLGTILFQEVNNVITINFLYHGLTYQIIAPIGGDLTAQRVQFQFQSLVKSTPSSDVTAQPVLANSSTVIEGQNKVTRLRNCPQIKIIYPATLESDLLDIDGHTTVSISNFKQAYGTYREPQPTDLYGSFNCDTNTDQPSILSLTQNVSYIYAAPVSTIPFIDTTFRNNVDPGSVWVQNTTLKCQQLCPELVDAQNINFQDRAGMYYELYGTNIKQMVKDWNLTIVWDETGLDSAKP